MNGNGNGLPQRRGERRGPQRRQEILGGVHPSFLRSGLLRGPLRPLRLCGHLFAAVLLLSMSAAFGQDAARPQAGEALLAIVGGDVYTGTGAVIRHGTVICRGRRIEAVGADLKVPEGARVIDATGRRVLPGLVVPLGTGMGVARGRPRAGEHYSESLDPENLNAELALSAGITAFHHEGERKGIWSATNAVVKPALGEPDLIVLKEPAALTVAWTSAVQERLGFEQMLDRTK